MARQDVIGAKRYGLARALWLGAILLIVALPFIAVAQQTAPPINSIAQAFANKGVAACAPRINQVTNFLGKGGNTGAFVFVPPTQPNQNLASASLEIATKGKNSAYASVSVAPNQANGCAAVYDAVAYWPMSCADVAAKQFPGKAAGGVVKEQINILVLDAATRVFLMPAGQGCVSIKKEVILQ